MADVVGKNTPSAALLRSYIERLERLDEQKKELSKDRTAVVAEAKSAGFDGPALNRLLRRRKAKPHDLAEADTLDDLYRHSAGMDAEPPLFRQLEALAKQSVAAEKLIEAFKLFVPPSGEVILTVGGKKLRFWRDKDGEPQQADYVEPDASPRETRAAAPAPKKDVPNCTPDEAEKLGEEAAKANEPIIANPFPYGDERRPRWDGGWRKGSGNDGMGPDD